MKNNIFLILLALFSVLSCNKNGTFEKSDSTTVLSQSPIIINQNVKNLVSDYLKKYSKCKSFVIICNPKRNTNIEGLDFDNDYLLGPSYEGLFKKEEYPLLFFECENNKIFIKTNMEELTNCNVEKESIFEENLIKRGVDSITNEIGWVIKNGNILFYYKAVYFTVSKNNSISILSYRPDTIFLPKYNKAIEFK